MNCQQARPLVELYADGELDASAVLDLDQHLQSCPACAREWRDLQELKRALRQDALFFPAPEGLRQQVRAALPARPRPAPARPAWSWNWLSAALAGTTAVCAGLLAMLLLSRAPSEQQLSGEIVSSHIRSLMAGHIVDVESTDQHTVKPWFNGKVDFSPPIKDLAPQGFPLVVGGHDAAALVFHRQKHIINLFIWPSKSPDSPPAAMKPQQGYHVIHWASDGMAFWAVSDLNEKELLEFAGDFAGRDR